MIMCKLRGAFFTPFYGSIFTKIVRKRYENCTKTVRKMYEYCTKTVRLYVATAEITAKNAAAEHFCHFSVKK